jgi:hypothetical protein
MNKLTPIETIVDMKIINYIDKKLKGKAVLGGRRALALAGINFKRPFSDINDHDFVIKHLSIRHTIFGNTFERVLSDKYGVANPEDLEKRHYRFKYNGISNCLFVNKDLITTTYRGIKIADPEQILYYKRKYIETSEKHKKDFENISELHYKLGHL